MAIHPDLMLISFGAFAALLVIGAVLRLFSRPEAVTVRTVIASPLPTVPSIVPAKTKGQTTPVSASEDFDIQFTVVRGIIGLSPQYSDLGIPDVELILRVRLINRSSQAITMRPDKWLVRLSEGDGNFLGDGEGRVIPNQLRFEEELHFELSRRPPVQYFDRDIITEVSRTPLAKDVPIEGWIRFSIHGPRKEYLFGATVKVQAKDDLDRDIRFSPKSPGRWVLPTKIYFASSEVKK